MEETTNTELVRSHVDTFILKTLQNKDSYPYEILREIEELSSGKYVLKQATLYSCMKRLEKVGYINSYWGTESEGGRRRYYSLTEVGKEFLERDKVEWEFSRTLINRLLSDKEVDLETALPPFDASSLRPLTKRNQTKASDPGRADEVQVRADTLIIESDPKENRPEDRKTEVATLLGGESSSETLSKEERERAAEESNAFQINPFINQSAETLPDGTNAGYRERDPQYLTKDPIFQHTLPVESRNYTTQEPLRFLPSERFFSAGEAARGDSVPRSIPAEQTKPERVEETEDMRAAADLLHIGKKFHENEIFGAESAEVPTRSEPAFPSQPKRAEENYRDVLNRIFDTDKAKTGIVPPSEKESAAAVLPSVAGAPHGRHLKELQAGLEKQGYTLRIYSPKNRSDYYYNKYLYQNKINFAVSFLLFVIMAAEFIVVAGLNGILRFNAITLILSGIAMCVPPIVAALIYFWNPSKRVRANYNFMQTFLYRSIFALILIAVEVILCLLVPTFGISFDDPRMYIPWGFSLNIPLYAILYELLYRSKRFHLSCAKF